MNQIEGSAGKLTMQPSAPSRAYLVGPEFQTNLSSLVQSAPSDTPGALFSVFQPTPTLDMVMDALKRQRLTVAFNRFGGGSDIQVPIELDVEGMDGSGAPTRSHQMIESFAKCLTILASSAEEAQ